MNRRGPSTEEHCRAERDSDAPGLPRAGRDLEGSLPVHLSGGTPGPACRRTAPVTPGPQVGAAFARGAMSAEEAAPCNSRFRPRRPPMTVRQPAGRCLPNGRTPVRLAAGPLGCSTLSGFRATLLGPSSQPALDHPGRPPPSGRPRPPRIGPLHRRRTSDNTPGSRNNRPGHTVRQGQRTRPQHRHHTPAPHVPPPPYPPPTTP